MLIYAQEFKAPSDTVSSRKNCRSAACVLRRSGRNVPRDTPVLLSGLYEGSKMKSATCLTLSLQGRHGGRVDADGARDVGMPEPFADDLRNEERVTARVETPPGDRRRPASGARPHPPGRHPAPRRPPAPQRRPRRCARWQAVVGGGGAPDRGPPGSLGGQPECRVTLTPQVRGQGGVQGQRPGWPPHRVKRRRAQGRLRGVGRGGGQLTGCPCTARRPSGSPLR